MLPEIRLSTSKKLVGRKVTMSLLDNQTPALFRGFMPRRGEIKKVLSPIVFDLKVYPEHYFQVFKPETSFEKWALMEVSEFLQIPEGMDQYELEGGQYARFIHKGQMMDKRIFEYIFREWLPKSDFELDSRPHFEKLGEKSRKNDPDSEEEIWIPIKEKA